MSESELKPLLCLALGGVLLVAVVYTVVDGIRSRRRRRKPPPRGFDVLLPSDDAPKPKDE